MRIEAPNRSDVAVTTHFGVLGVDLKHGAGSVVVESSSFGVSNGFDGFTLGYRSATLAALGRDDCRIVVWIRSEEDLKTLQQVIGEKSDICAVRALQQFGEKP